MDNKQFIESATNLLNSIPPCDGFAAKLAHKLSEAIDRLQELENLLDKKTTPEKE